MSKNKTILKISAKTDKGVERDHNEDDHLFCPDLKNNQWKFFEKTENYELGEFGSLIIVADGMGGMNAGEVASRLAKEGIQEYFSVNLRTEVLQDESKMKSFMKNAILSANEKIVKNQKEDKETEGMGTTIILAWIYTNKVYVSWSGDSRCYRYNQASGLQALSKDHSYVQELIDDGKLTEEQAFYHPDSNIVSQSLGDEKHKPKPDFKSYELHEGDKILLCSDGLNAMLQDIQIREVFEKNIDINSCVDTLIEESNKAGGHDNITIAIAEIEKVGSAFVPAKNVTAKLKTYVKYAGIAVFAFLIVFVYLKFFHKKEETEKQNFVIAQSDMLAVTKNDNIIQDTIRINKGDTLLTVNNDTVLVRHNDTLVINRIKLPQNITDNNNEPSNEENTETDTTNNSELPIIDENLVLEQLLPILENIKDALIKVGASGTNTNNFTNQIGAVKLAYENYFTTKNENNKIDVCTKIVKLIELRGSLNINSKKFKDAFKQLETFNSIFCKTVKINLPEKENITPEVDTNKVKVEISNTGKYDKTKDPDNIGLSPIKKDNKWGYIGIDNKIKITCKYLVALQFHEGYAFYKTSKGWGVIDKNGIPKILPQEFWTPKGYFNNGKAKVTNVRNEEYYINLRGLRID